MAERERPMHPPVNYAFPLTPRHSQDEGDTRRVEAVVVALIPEFQQVKVRDGDGHLYALTSKTQGVDLASLHEGQHVICTVTRRLPRVLAATAVA